MELKKIKLSYGDVCLHESHGDYLLRIPHKNYRQEG